MPRSGSGWRSFPIGRAATRGSASAIGRAQIETEHGEGLHALDREQFRKREIVPK